MGLTPSVKIYNESKYLVKFSLSAQQSDNYKVMPCHHAKHSRATQFLHRLVVIPDPFLLSRKNNDSDDVPIVELSLGRRGSLSRH